MAKQYAWQNARGRMQWKEWVIKKERKLEWWEKGDLSGATNCSGWVRTFTRAIGGRQKTLLSERQLCLTPVAGGKNKERVDLRCTVPTWGRTMWHRLVAWYFTARPDGLTKQGFLKKRDHERFLYEWEVHHFGFNHRVTRWQAVGIGRWEDNKAEYAQNWQRYSRKRPASVMRRPASAM